MQSTENTQRHSGAVVATVVVHWLTVVIYYPSCGSDSVWSTG